MERRRAPCGRAERHEPHRTWVPDHSDFYGRQVVDCPGWDGQDADASDLADRLDEVARDAWRPAPLQHGLPPGIRLECHPLVPHVLEQLFIPSYGEFVTSLADARLGGPGVAHWLKPQIPVLVIQGMERGQWRITADGGLIAEGTVRDD